MKTIMCSPFATVKHALKWTALAVVILVLAQATVSAEDKVSVLMKQSLADMAGKVATVLTVDYAPGAVSDAHVHPGSVFAYVLEGSVILEMDGKPPQTFRSGEAFVELPGMVHNFRNASASDPAKALGFQVAPKGAPLQTNVQ